MKFLNFLLATILLISCQENKPAQDVNAEMNSIAQQYVRLGLDIGQYDTDFVDAYYGPDSLKPAAPKLAAMPVDSFQKKISTLLEACNNLAANASANDSLKQRVNWLTKQLTAFQKRVNIFSGKTDSFDNESNDLFSVKAPVYDEAHFKALVQQLDAVLPGTGSIPERSAALSKKFIIPKDKIDTVFKTAIAEARKRTMAFIDFPSNESFTLEYVTNKPWSGYNWYKGNYNSVIQINTDLPIAIERAIDLGCHEGYPGHHVYNMLLEKNLYRDKGQVEISLYPLFSPQSLIAEGSANYGIEMAFPGTEKNKYCKEVLLPLAGLDTAGIDTYFKVIELKSALNYARNEAARGMINKTMSDTATLKWLVDYNLTSVESATKSMSFIKKYRSYVICYNYGQDLVRKYVETKTAGAADTKKRWTAFAWILSNAVTPGELSEP